MNKTQAQIRNQKILRLRGILPRLYSLLPEDLKELHNEDDLLNFRIMLNSLSEGLNTIKVKRYTCSSCNDTQNLKPTQNKKAIICDFCNKWFKENNKLNLYIFKSKKEN